MSQLSIRRQFTTPLAVLTLGFALSACGGGGSTTPELPESGTLRLLDVQCQELRAAGLFDGVQEDLLQFFVPGGFPVSEGASAIMRFGLATIRVTETADVLTSPLLDPELDPAQMPLLLVDTLRCATADANRGLIQLNRSLGPAAVTLGRSFLPPSEALLLEFEALLNQLNTVFIQFDEVLLPKRASPDLLTSLQGLSSQLRVLALRSGELAAALPAVPEAAPYEMSLRLLEQSLHGTADLLAAQVAGDAAAAQMAYQAPLQSMQVALQQLLASSAAADEPLARGAVPSLLESLAVLDQRLIQALAAPLRSLLEILNR